MICIFCRNENDAKSVEHIVPESFGNNLYILPKGVVCDECNNKFSNFEGKALTNSIFAMERSRFGVVTKKGKNSKGKVNDLIIEGDKEFRKKYITIKGLDQDNTRNYNQKEKTLEVIIPTFDKSEVATSKLLLSMGLEAIYKSQKTIYESNNFTDLENYLTAIDNKDWPFVVSKFDMGKYLSIPTFGDKYNLKKKHCKLKYLNLREDTLLFQFNYGGITMIINLLNRDLGWIQEMFDKDNKTDLHPEHYRKKIKTV